MTSFKRLGDLLVNQGLISAWQLDGALKEQRATQEFIGTILVRKGWLEEAVLLRILADQAGIPYGSLNPSEIDWSLSKRFPPSLLRDHLCFPMRMDAFTLTVAIANPLDAWAISELERIAGPRKLERVLVSACDIREAIQQSYQRALKLFNLDGKTGEQENSDEGKTG